MDEETPRGMSFDEAAELVASKLYFGNAADWDRCVKLLTTVFAVLVRGTQEEIADDLEKRAMELGGRSSWTKAHTLRAYAKELRSAGGLTADEMDTAAGGHPCKGRANEAEAQADEL